MGDAEVKDQLAGVEWLKKQPFVDPSKVAVHGLVVRRLHDLEAAGEGAGRVRGRRRQWRR